MSSPLFSSRITAWSVWLIASFFYAYQYILRVMPNILLGDIMLQFDIGAATFGQFTGVYYIGYSLMHLPIGMMLDRFGPRKIMSICILLTVIGLCPLLFASHWAYPILGRMLIGVGSSAAILGLFKITRIIFSEDRFSRMLSLSVTIGLLGAIYGGAPISYMRDGLGYQTVVQILAALGIFLAGLTYCIVPSIPSTAQNTIYEDIKEVITNRRVLFSCAFAGMMVGPLEGFADVWGTAFLKQNYGLHESIAAGLPSLIFIGMCFGGPLLTLIAEKSGHYFATIVAAGCIMTLSFFSLLSFNLTSTGLSMLFFLIGACSSYQILAIYKASTFVREHVAGLTTAFANMIIMIFGYAFHSAMGGIINAVGGPELPQAMFYGILVVPIGLCFGTAGFIGLILLEKRQTQASLSRV